MTDDASDDRLRASDEAWVHRIASEFAAAPQSAAQRAAFVTTLDERIARGRRRRAVLGSGALVVVASVVALVIVRFSQDAPLANETRPGASVASATDTPGVGAAQADAILALAIAPETASDERLPDDYEAIAGVLLGG